MDTDFCGGDNYGLSDVGSATEDDPATEDEARAACASWACPPSQSREPLPSEAPPVRVDATTAKRTRQKLTLQQALALVSCPADNPNARGPRLRICRVYSANKEETPYTKSKVRTYIRDIDLHVHAYLRYQRRLNLTLRNVNVPRMYVDQGGAFFFPRKKTRHCCPTESIYADRLRELLGLRRQSVAAQDRCSAQQPAGGSSTDFRDAVAAQ